MSYLHKAFGLGSPFSLYSIAAFDGDEPLGLIELDESLDDVEKPEELPQGVYTGEVQDVQIMTSNKGNKYFAIKFVIPPDEIAADLQDAFPDGAILFWNRQLVPTPKDRRSMFNLKKLVGALGLDTKTTQIDPNEWMGCTARLRIRHSTYQGESRAEISAVESAEAKAPARGQTATRRGRAAEQEQGDEEEVAAPRGRQRPQAAAAGGRRRR